MLLLGGGRSGDGDHGDINVVVLRHLGVTRDHIDDVFCVDLPLLSEDGGRSADDRRTRLRIFFGLRIESDFDPHPDGVHELALVADDELLVEGEGVLERVLCGLEGHHGRLGADFAQRARRIAAAAAALCVFALDADELGPSPLRSGI